MLMQITVNGEERTVKSSIDTPILYVLRNELSIKSPKFGCGLAQCGACSVLLDGKEIRSCITPLAAVGGKKITTIEGLPSRWSQNIDVTIVGENELHPVQQAWIKNQTPLCGFCQSGMMIKAVELLESNTSPSLEEIKQAFTKSGTSPHLCRCGSYKAIIESVADAALLMKQKGNGDE